MSTRKFPEPWRVEETNGGNYVVRDSNGFGLAYVYCREEEALRGDYLTPAEALKIAGLIAQLPELWRK